MKPYYPSCGAEGLDFQSQFCFRCEQDAAYSEDHPERGCSILAASYAGPVDEWVYDDDGKPTCTVYTPEVKP